MFKGKVCVYKNINWKEEKIEREFDNPNDFQSFANTNAVWWLDSLASPMLWLGDWANLQTYFDSLIDRRFWLSYDWEDDYQESFEHWWFVDLRKYEDELEKIEYQKQHKDDHLKLLKDDLHKLKEYKKKFKDEGRDDVVENIDFDIKNIEQEIKSLDK